MLTRQWSDLRSLLRRWSRDWGGLLVLGLGAYLLLYFSWWYFRWGPADLELIIANLAMVPINIGAAILAWRTSNRLEHRRRTAWRLIALSQVSWLVGNLLWTYLEHVLQVSPFPSVADIFFLGFYPFMIAAVLVGLAPGRSPGAQLRSWLDTGTMILAGWMVVWLLVVGPGLTLAGTDPVIAGLSLVYPLGDLLLLFAMIMLLLRSPGEVYAGTLALQAVGVLLLVVGDVGHGYLNLHTHTGYSGDDWPDLFWTAGVYLLAASAHVRWEARSAPGGPRFGLQSELLAFLPYMAVGVSSLFLIVVAHEQGLHQYEGFLYMALVITGLVLIRQIMMLLENQRLLRESKGLTDSLQRSEERFRTLVQNSSDVITVMEPDSTVRDQSPSIERVFGYQPGELIGQRLVGFIHPDELAKARTFRADVSAGGAPHVVEFRFRHKDGSWRHTETTIASLLHDPNVRGLVLNTRDITERKVLEEQLRHQAFHDPLTGLSNRVLFRQEVEKALAACQPGPGVIAVLFLDLDGFKTVNDSLGHDAGDQLLVLVAERFRHFLRSDDRVSRLGGDEFAILLEDVSESEAIQTAAGIMDSLELPFRVQGKEVFVQTSLGIAISSACSTGAEELLRNADVAMYTAKGAGKGRYALFEPAMHTAALRRLELEADLRRAIESHELELFYQPTVDLQDGHIVGVEALLRWRHPERGMVLPGEFIPLAEETGLILPIGRWVLQEACTRAKGWHDRYPDRPRLTISINISGKQLQHPTLVKEVALALSGTGLTPDSLVLEITESVLMQNPEAVTGRLQELRALGVRMAVDDFGTGYSSLSYLQRFPVDIIKIDRSFVRDMGDGDKHHALTRSITGLASALELKTVAEGIEEEWQAAELRKLACHMGQGYYFARPVVPQAIDELLERGRQEIGADARK